jgi:hypothetical protein
MLDQEIAAAVAIERSATFYGIGLIGFTDACRRHSFDPPPLGAARENAQAFDRLLSREQDLGGPPDQGAQCTAGDAFALCTHTMSAFPFFTPSTLQVESYVTFLSQPIAPMVAMYSLWSGVRTE